MYLPSSCQVQPPFLAATDFVGLAPWKTQGHALCPTTRYGSTNPSTLKGLESSNEISKAFSCSTLSMTHVCLGNSIGVLPAPVSALPSFKYFAKVRLLIIFFPIKDWKSLVPTSVSKSVVIFEKVTTGLGVTPVLLTSKPSPWNGIAL